MTSFTDEQKQEIKGIVHEALIEFFASKGTFTKNAIITTATIIGSLAVIAGGIKIVFAAIGITILHK